MGRRRAGKETVETWEVGMNHEETCKEEAEGQDDARRRRGKGREVVRREKAAGARDPMEEVGGRDKATRRR